MIEPTAEDEAPRHAAPREAVSIGVRRVPTLAAVASAAAAVISGAAPHVLHHVGPLAGTALLAGAGGTIVFAAAGLALSIPMLLRLRRRFGTWAAPAVAMAVFAGVYLFSALVLGPALRGEQGAVEAGAGHHARAVGSPRSSLTRPATAPACGFQTAVDDERFPVMSRDL